MATTAENVKDYRHGRVPRPVRERQIRAIAATLFAERGFAGTSMEEIARRSNLSRPVVYDLARSKTELFITVLEEALDDITTALAGGLDDSDDLWQGLRAGLTAFFRFGDANPAMFRLVITATGGDPELDKKLLALRSRSNRHLTTLYRDLAIRSGVNLDATRAQAMAHATQGACDYVARWRLGDASDLTPDTAATWVADLLEPGLRSLLEP